MSSMKPMALAAREPKGPAEIVLTRTWLRFDGVFMGEGGLRVRVWRRCLGMCVFRVCGLRLRLWV